MIDDPVIHPRIIPWSHGERSDVVILASLFNVLRQMVVRITGGCADMNADDANGVLELFAGAFEGFDGALLIGGTRMIQDDDLNKVLFGITEVGPYIRQVNPTCHVLGVIPRVNFWDFTHDGRALTVVHSVESASEVEHTTIVHPNQDTVVGVTSRLTSQKIWDDEIEFCRYITHYLRFGGWGSVLIAYNGGGATEREIHATAERGWPVLLVKGSGRKTDEFAANPIFLRDHPNVRVCENSVASMRHELAELGVVDVPRVRNHLRAVNDR